MKVRTLFLGIILIYSGITYSEIPKQMSFQGVVTDSSGLPLVDSTVSVEFAIFDASSGGNTVWSEILTVTTNSLGLITVTLGLLNPIEDSVFNGANRYMSLNVQSDGEILPRIKLTSLGYSNRVSTIDGATGGIVSGNTSFEDDLVVTGKLGVGTSPSVKLEVEQGNSIRLGSAYISSGYSPYSFFSSNHYFNGTTHQIPNPSINSSTLEITDFAFRFYMTQIPGVPDFQARMSIEHTGNVGIGTVSPTEKLHVVGNILTEGTLIANSISSLSPLQLQTGGVTRAYVDDITGNIGIGTTTPNARLEVDGDLKVTGSILGSTPWTPFPFAAGYEDYVDAHGEGYQRVQYRKIGDIIYLRGSAHKIDHTPIMGGDTLGTLPLGFRPPAFELYMSYNQAFQITPDGQVILISGGDHARNLYQISFSTSP